MSKPNGWGQFIFLAHRSPEGREAFRAYREQRELALAAPAKLNSQSNQRIDVAKGANIREDDAHSEIRSPE